jgi:hypothetical protein
MRLTVGRARYYTEASSFNAEANSEQRDRPMIEVNKLTNNYDKVEALKGVLLSAHLGSSD